MSVDQHLVKISTHAATSAAIGHFMFSKGDNIATPLGPMSPWMVYGALGVASSAGADLISNFFVPQLSKDARTKTVESHLIGMGGAGVSFLAAEYIVNPAMAKDRMQEALMIGAGAEILSNYIYTSFAQPLTSDASYQASSLGF
jgi:hypothetical protein